MEESEWKKNFRMILAIDVRPFLEPSSGPCGDDILSVEKQSRIGVYS